MTDDALVQRLLQMETTVKGLSSEIQKMKEEMMDQDARHKNSEKQHSCSLSKSIMIENMVNKHGTEGPLQANQVFASTAASN